MGGHQMPGQGLWELANRTVRHKTSSDRLVEVRI